LNIKDEQMKMSMSDSKDLKIRIVKLISSVYSQWNVAMMNDTYKSNVKCQLFLKKLKDVYDSVLKFSNITQQYSLDFTMSNDKTRPLLRETCRQWNQIPENIRKNFEKITQSIQTLENLRQETYNTNKGIDSTTTNPKPLIKTSTSNSSNPKKTIVQLINSVYSQWEVEMTNEPYKSDKKCQLFLEKLRKVYDSVLKFSQSTRQYSLEFMMSNDETRPLLEEACIQWNKMPENIRDKFKNITRFIQTLEKLRQDTYTTNQGIESTTTNAERIKTSSLLCELYTLCV
jgi:hypothetical protein